jgi:hypothetical protein
VEKCCFSLSALDISMVFYIANVDISLAVIFYIAGYKESQFLVIAKTLKTPVPDL